MTRVAIPDLMAKHRRGVPIVMVTAYDAVSAQVAEEAGVDLVLVGDTAAMVVHGHQSTVPVSLDEMLMMTSSARRGLRTPILVGDLPFGSYERSTEQAVESAQRLVKEGGADVVKFEGPAADRARAIVAAGIPVIGHLGLTPQTSGPDGGFITQARTTRAALRLLDEALGLQEAGCFALVLEAVPAAVARAVTERLSIPTIGIGAGPGTSGQVMVLNDLLGVFEDFQPRFVKRYAHLRRDMVRAVTEYADDVRAGRFPAEEHCYPIADDELERFLHALG